MPSQLKLDTARGNGAKSKGPVTGAGKAISCRNAVTHGLTTRHITLLDCEDAAEFENLIAYYEETYLPATEAERIQVHDMVDSRWQLRRLGLIRSALFAVRMIRGKAAVEKEFERADLSIHLGEAFTILADKSLALAALNRHDARLRRVHDRALRTLLEMQRERRLTPLPQTPPPASSAPKASSPVLGATLPQSPNTGISNGTEHGRSSAMPAGQQAGPPQAKGRNKR